MLEEIEQRLAAAAQAVVEHEVTTRRSSDLSARQDEVAAELADLRSEYAGELKDVARLEGLSLTRVLVALRGSRDERLARERAEADAAEYRVAEAQARLDAVGRELDLAQRRLDRLAGAVGAYAAILDQKERYLTRSGDPRGRALLRLADERGRLTGERKELTEASQAAGAAFDALSEVEKQLTSAADWSAYDTFFGGGIIASSIKHSRLDDAAQAAAEADWCLAALRTELADVADLGLTAPRFAIGEGTRFIDVWFDNFFTDMLVRDRIKQARQNVDRSPQRVQRVHARLKTRRTQVRAGLTAIESDRRELLSS